MKNINFELKQEYVVILGILAIILLVFGVGILAYGLSRGGGIETSLIDFRLTPTPDTIFDFDIPDIEVTPPASLDEIATEIRDEYPELADLLENPELGSVYKDFYLAYQTGGKNAAIALARQRGILNDDNEIEMTLVLDTEDASDLVAELESEGVIIKGHFRHLVNIAVPVSVIEEQMNDDEPKLIMERLTNSEHVIRIEFPRKARIQEGEQEDEEEGIRIGQGVNVTMASHWHAQGITGKGVKVGILDLGFGGYKKLLGEELPKNVTVKIFGDDDDFNDEVHGVACAEIVHEMAPEAELYLVYFDGTDVAMGQAIEWLISQEVDIISNSTGSTGTEPMDGTGFTAELVDEAYEAGIFFASAAGNSAMEHYRGKFTDTNGDNLHDFAPNKQLLAFGHGLLTPVRIVLSWDDWQNADQDYDIHLYNQEGTHLQSSDDIQNGGKGQTPVESITDISLFATVHYITIENAGGKARGDSTFDLFIEPADMDPNLIVSKHSLASPSDAKGAFSIGAVHWYDDILEHYSSRGPTSDGRIKPDFSAPSVVDSTSYDTKAFNGTSAATPHVAGAAALILQAFPNFTPDDIGQFIKNRSIDLGDEGADNAFGVGRLNLGLSPEDATISTTPAPLPTSSFAIHPTSTPRTPSKPSRTQPGEFYWVINALIYLGLCLICVGIFIILFILLAIVIATQGACLIVGCLGITCMVVIGIVLAVIGSV